MRSALTPSRTPFLGASIFMIAGVDNVSVPAATTTGLITFTWPIPMKLTEMMLLPRSGLKTDLAGLSMRIFDEDGELITDGQNISTGAAFAAGLQETGVAPLVFKLTGWTWSPQWKPFTRVVHNGERWKFQITNATAGAIVPRLGFGYEVIAPGAAA